MHFQMIEEWALYIGLAPNGGSAYLIVWDGCLFEDRRLFERALNRSITVTEYKQHTSISFAQAGHRAKCKKRETKKDIRTYLG